jgi:DNA-binding MarR family transcriptional regulator
VFWEIPPRPPPQSVAAARVSGPATSSCYVWHTNLVRAEAVAAIRAWTRLDQAIAGFNRVLERRHGVTGAQLAVLRLVREWATPPRGGRAHDVVPLSVLRQRLVMHPASLGQLLDRLAERGLVTLTPDPADRRRRLVTLTADGIQVIRDAPLGGPVRLRHIEEDPDRLRRLAAAFEDAIVLFGLKEYDHDRSTDPAQHRPETGR